MKRKHGALSGGTGSTAEAELMLQVILTAGRGAELTVRLCVGEAVRVSQRCHGFHGEARQVVIVPVVKISLVGVSFDCRHKAGRVMHRHFYGIRHTPRYGSTYLGQCEWCSAKGSLSCPGSCPGVGRSHAVLDPSGSVNLGVKCVDVRYFFTSDIRTICCLL